MSALAVAATGVGALINVYGQIKGNQDQAAADQANAAFYEQQANFAKSAGDREMQVYGDQAAEAIGNQKSGFAKAGVELQGSPLLALADSRNRANQEETAISQNTNEQISEDNLKAQNAQTNANNLSSFTNNFLPAAGTILTAGAQAYGAATNGGRSAGSISIGGGYSGSNIIGSGSFA